MKSLIRKFLMGDTAFSPYSKITAADQLREKVYLELPDRLLDVSGSHWILCIEPLVFGVWIGEAVGPVDECRLYFCDGDLDGSGPGRARAAEPGAHGDAEAIVSAKLLDRVDEEEGSLLLLELKSSRIHSLPFLKTWLLYYRYYRKGLPFARFKAYVAAYSYPRRIRIVSFRQDDYYNIFPMDLLGAIPGQDRYVFGLRHTNTALPRILETGDLVVSEASFRYKDLIYGLGKHHSGSPPPPEDLPFRLALTDTFGFPTPDWVESYKEVRIVKTLDMGSHMLLWGEVIHEKVLTPPVEHLFLVHFLHYLHQKNNGFIYQGA